jgi:RNA polymerase sigma-70 factor (ECF subfamily)
MRHSVQQCVSLTDEQLVRLARCGDQDALGVLFQRHRRKCIVVGCYYLRNLSDAEDQVQNAFLKACERLDQFHGDAAFSTWLARIVANECLMLMRVRRRIHPVELDRDSSESTAAPFQLPAPGPDPEGEWGYQQMTGALRLAVKRLPRLLREVVLLHDLHELSLRDVANQLEISVPAVKSRLVRAREELRLRMSSQCPGSGGSPVQSRQAAPLQKVGRRCASRMAA